MYRNPVVVVSETYSPMHRNPVVLVSGTHGIYEVR
jgi:hypothetical protein